MRKETALAFLAKAKEPADIVKIIAGAESSDVCEAALKKLGIDKFDQEKILQLAEVHAHRGAVFMRAMSPYISLTGLSIKYIATVLMRNLDNSYGFEFKAVNGIDFTEARFDELVRVLRYVDYRQEEKILKEYIKASHLEKADKDFILRLLGQLNYREFAMNELVPFLNEDQIIQVLRKEKKWSDCFDILNLNRTEEELLNMALDNSDISSLLCKIAPLLKEQTSLLSLLIASKDPSVIISVLPLLKNEKVIMAVLKELHFIHEYFEAAIPSLSQDNLMLGLEKYLPCGEEKKKAMFWKKVIGRLDLSKLKEKELWWLLDKSYHFAPVMKAIKPYLGFDKMDEKKLWEVLGNNKWDEVVWDEVAPYLKLEQKTAAEVSDIVRYRIHGEMAVLSLLSKVRGTNEDYIYVLTHLQIENKDLIKTLVSRLVREKDQASLVSLAHNLRSVPYAFELVLETITDSTCLYNLYEAVSQTQELTDMIDKHIKKVA